MLGNLRLSRPTPSSGPARRINTSAAFRTLGEISFFGRPGREESSRPCFSRRAQFDKRPWRKTYAECDALERGAFAAAGAKVFECAQQGRHGQVPDREVAVLRYEPFTHLPLDRAAQPQRSALSRSWVSASLPTFSCESAQHTPGQGSSPSITRGATLE